jgi:hypothetical protein
MLVSHDEPARAGLEPVEGAGGGGAVAFVAVGEEMGGER